MKNDFKSVRCEQCGFVDIKRDIVVIHGMKKCKDCANEKGANHKNMAVMNKLLKKMMKESRE